jgi:hypothetical protein
VTFVPRDADWAHCMHVGWLVRGVGGEVVGWDGHFEREW